MGQKPGSKEVIILTGGAGFIGSCFLWKLNQEGEKNIIVVDEMVEGDPKGKNLFDKDFLDFYDKDDFIGKIRANSFPHKIKAIWHIGACSSTMVMDKEFLRQNNTEYSKTLVEFALKENIP
ncbi:MAG: NAD-dependent epimerase/dehydratase family protein, partial [bacterium]